MGVSPSILSSVNTKNFKESHEAPSFGCLIGDRGNSEPGTSIFSDDTPPSLTDVARRDTSKSSFDQNLYEVKFEEASSSTITFEEISQDHEPFSGSFGKWQKGEMLGRGSFATVYEGIHDQGYFFAVKELSLLHHGHGKQSIAQLEQEISLLSKFHHDNIVRYLGTDTGDGKLYIFLELVTKGSLAKLYQKYQLQDSQVSLYTRQILSGLSYLHQQSVIHRDIKCANILIDGNGIVKLADFGLETETALNDFKSCRGTAYWMAPEVVNKSSKTWTHGYGFASDIWSLGCTVLEMFTRKLPYHPLEVMPALFRIGSGLPPPIPSTLSVEAQHFILQCLQANPKDRPTAAKLLDHPFLLRSQ